MNTLASNQKAIQDKVEQIIDALLLECSDPRDDGEPCAKGVMADDGTESEARGDYCPTCWFARRLMHKALPLDPWQITAQQRANGILGVLKWAWPHQEYVCLNAIIDELNAHAAAARREERERIAKMVERKKSTLVFGIGIEDRTVEAVRQLYDEIAVAIRALPDVEVP